MVVWRRLLVTEPWKQIWCAEVGFEAQNLIMQMTEIVICNSRFPDRQHLRRAALRGTDGVRGESSGARAGPATIRNTAQASFSSSVRVPSDAKVDMKQASPYYSRQDDLFIIGAVFIFWMYDRRVSNPAIVRSCSSIPPTP